MCVLDLETDLRLFKVWRKACSNWIIDILLNRIRKFSEIQQLILVDDLQIHFREEFVDFAFLPAL